MLDYAVCEINGKQVKVLPNHPFEVDWLGQESKNIEVSTLLLSDEGKIKIGTPYLKDKITLENLGMVRGKKIRVAKFHAKANFRKVTGSRSKKTKVVYLVNKA